LLITFNTNGAFRSAFNFVAYRGIFKDSNGKYVSSFLLGIQYIFYAEVMSVIFSIEYA